MEANTVFEWKNGDNSLRKLLADGHSITIKYTWLIEIDKPQSVLIRDSQGSFSIESPLPNQKFYCNTLMVPVLHNDEKLQKIIKVRNLLFMNSQLYVNAKDAVLKLRSNTGLISLVVSNKDYRKLMREIHLHSKTLYSYGNKH